MSERKRRYIEEQVGMQLGKDENSHYTITFQNEEIKLHDTLEAKVLDGCDPHTTREIEQNEDDFVIKVKPVIPLRSFGSLRNKEESVKLFVAHALIQKVIQHDHDKLHLIVSPENVLVSDGLDVTFIHYGVKDSIPPYETDPERLFLELRATLLVLLDGNHRFHEYMNYHDTLKLSPEAKSLVQQTTLEGLRELIRHWIQEHEQQEKQLHKVPKTKWTIQKWAGIGLIAALVPAIIYIVYVLAFLQPRQEAFTASHAAYLNENYSQVIDTLEPYSPNSMPRVVKYQLAQSYVAIEPLQAYHRENLKNVLVLQAAESYFDYWIAIGRGENEKAIDIARGLQDKEWLVYANVKRREEVKSDENLSGKEREDLIKEIEAEIDDYMRELEELAEEGEAFQPNAEPAASNELEEDEGDTEEDDSDNQEAKDEDKDKKQKDKDGGDK
ncbi:type VII secretion protein EssB [Halalkalibacterium halodurans]|uniref:BH0974 protein n=1 Tax=Halalkalibacterium halodurans (strain ATCC BAA-125 / DSM 18197 / FERM 7344 / JCM 9153 / C-125) TaxID=272558 RepID=Q9KE82_HALH5|nr:type VII secretion protein EssB [Halalkalibacterium halodurans]MED4082023.1 type VII secretion protein EssB [Halalkalibacterium halodurans]MED4085540.1 type VII secretion protein EssB [Halalkalibacterium halodurans]MED4103412.1 type VII secretion protein EssB [Halalkalibacterium halodurans]MED4110134.1 type VII secretion protein EssB [Halalkalibacterium halodurans]MED4124182.1 type VII secretion protein EssB [Halalkalibacterium halodurans]